MCICNVLQLMGFCLAIQHKAYILKLNFSQNNRSLVAFSVRPIEDMNEITSHMLDVVQAHMLLSKPQTMVRKTFTKKPP